MFQMKVECPRCGKIWTVTQGTPDIECNCHLYCTQGDKPSDCSVTAQNYNGPLKWPAGLDTGKDDAEDDILHRTYYCTTHDEYYTKVPILLECDWDKWFGRRAPKRLRMSQGEY